MTAEELLAQSNATLTQIHNLLFVIVWAIAMVAAIFLTKFLYDMIFRYIRSFIKLRL